MWYLVGKLFWLLAIAFLVGLAVGWATSSQKPSAPRKGE